MCGPVLSSSAAPVQTMSGNNRHAPPRAQQTDPLHDSSLTVSTALSQRVGDGEGETTPESVLSTVVADILDEDEIDVPEGVVTQSLDEILVALIALCDDATHGTGLMEELATLFDVQPSPGSVYPRLHDLDGDGTLTRHDLVQTKQYAIDDADRADQMLERAMQHHLALGLFLQAARDTV